MSIKQSFRTTGENIKKDSFYTDSRPLISVCLVFTALSYLHVLVYTF